MIRVPLSSDELYFELVGVLSDRVSATARNPALANPDDRHRLISARLGELYSVVKAYSDG